MVLPAITDLRNGQVSSNPAGVRRGIILPLKGDYIRIILKNENNINYSYSYLQNEINSICHYFQAIQQYLGTVVVVFKIFPIQVGCPRVAFPVSL